MMLYITVDQQPARNTSPDPTDPTVKWSTPEIQLVIHVTIAFALHL